VVTFVSARAAGGATASKAVRPKVDQNDAVVAVDICDCRLRPELRMMYTQVDLRVGDIDVKYLDASGAGGAKPCHK
jgi:hypothetical protein